MVFQQRYLSKSQKLCCRFFNNHHTSKFALALDRVVFFSLTLFNYTIDWIFSKTITNFPSVEISPDFQLTDFNYTDDVAILGKNFGDIQLAIDKLQVYASKVGIKINAQKTKLLTADFFTSKKRSIIHNEEIHEEVDRCKYLGWVITAKG